MSMRVLFLCLLVVLLGPAPTAHGANEIGVSRDGITFTPDLTMPLFDPSFRWVPGDAETETFFVRHQGSSAGRLAIDVNSADPDALLARDDITLSVRVGTGDWVPFETTHLTEPLGSTTIPAGVVRPVQVRAVFDPASTNRSEVSTVPLSFRITLTEALPGAGSDGGSLPDTGMSVPSWALWFALVLCLSGAALMANRPSEVDDAS